MKVISSGAADSDYIFELQIKLEVYVGQGRCSDITRGGSSKSTPVVNSQPTVSSVLQPFYTVMFPHPIGGRACFQPFLGPQKSLKGRFFQLI